MRCNQSILAFIPARSGSKGLANKNILNCAGKPLIGWTIEAARGVETIDEVFVSTDTEEIASIAKDFGATVPFLRSKELSTDTSSLKDAMLEAWGQLKDRNGKPFDYLLLLQPTSPLRSQIHIAAAIEYYFEMRQSERDTMASVYKVPSKYGWLMEISEEPSHYIHFSLDVAKTNPQRQNLKHFYLPNGAIFIVPGISIVKGFYTEQTIPFVMEPTDSIDIDTRAEFDQAADILAKRRRDL